MSDRAETAFSFAAATAEFRQAWDDPAHTRFELPAVDVNRVLAERYIAEQPLTMTRTQIWDMEVKKAWDPATYIPYVVFRGGSWGRHALEEGCERFFRASDQAAWIDDTRGQVLEDVSISHGEQRIFFLGRAALTRAGGERLEAGDFQPLFHVEHAAGGPEGSPLNIWRIVSLTPAPDPRFARPFERMVAAGLLPGFIERYIEKDLGVFLRRR